MIIERVATMCEGCGDIFDRMAGSNGAGSRHCKTCLDVVLVTVTALDALAALDAAIYAATLDDAIEAATRELS